MSEQKHPSIVAFVGLPGVGKTAAVDYVVSKGFPKIYFGGILYEEMKREGIEITPKSQQIFREEWRERDGKDVIVKKAIEQISNLIDAGQRRIVLDGLYTWTEYKLLKHAFPGEMKVIAIVAPRHLRYHRLSNRPERPFTYQEAEERDWSEIENLEKGGPIAVADYFIHNDTSLDQLYGHIDETLREIHFID